MASKFSFVLIGSLALNAVLLGIVGGRVFSPSQAAEPTVQMQLERYGPTSDVVAAAWAELPDAERVELRKELKESWLAMADERKQLGAAGRAVYEAALAEPFDENHLRDAVAIFQLREKRLQDNAENILIRHLGRMPPKARATAATGLLTPFNARVQRADRKDRPPTSEGTGLAPAPLSPQASAASPPGKPPSRKP